MPSVVGNTKGPQSRAFCGVLAEMPLTFAGCYSICKSTQLWIARISGLKQSDKNPNLDNAGANFWNALMSLQYILPLDCSSAPDMFLGVRVKKYGFNIFIREDPQDFVVCTERFYAEAPPEVYLLTKLPETNLHHDFQYLDMRLFIAQSRPHIFQIKLPLGTHHCDIFPQGRFDFEDQTIFCIRRHYTRFRSLYCDSFTNPTYEIMEIKLESSLIACSLRQAGLNLNLVAYGTHWQTISCLPNWCVGSQYITSPEIQASKSQDHPHLPSRSRERKMVALISFKLSLVIAQVFVLTNFGR